MKSKLRKAAADDVPGLQPRALLPLKTQAIEIACRRFSAKSFADLGGVWGVNAGYSFHALEQPGVERVVIADGEFNDTVLERAAKTPNVETVKGYLGSPETVEAVGKVDAVLMFDILLHQVSPDWDELLAAYAPNTSCFVLVGPWWRGESTQRLLELPREESLDLLPFKRNDYAAIMDHLDEFNSKRGRNWRDVADIWQWGIPDGDLRRCMDELGFALAHHENLGAWNQTERSFDASYIFVRREML